MSKAETSYPIDPISHEPILPEKQIKITMQTHDEYFDIDNLDTWFVTRGEAINPLTNIGFTKKQIQDIRKAYLEKSKKLPYFLHPAEDENKEQQEKEEQERLFQLKIFQMKFMDLCESEDKIEELRDLLYSNVEDINNDKFNLNIAKKVNFSSVQTVTPIMNAVYYDNLLAVQELLVFNPELNYADPKLNYKAIDLAVVSSGKNSYTILENLLYYGAKTDIVTKNGYTAELTSNSAKLDLLYTFMYE